jgi:DNA-binding response OmpR family regulator
MSRLGVLFVDDDPQICRMMRTILTAQGFDVTLARGGGEAVEKLRSADYELVLLDINMPGMDGIAACREMRAQSDVPIIMLTVCTEESERTDAFEAGADDYLTKPFRTPELLAHIDSTLSKKLCYAAWT